MKKVPKYREIANNLAKKIEQGVYSSGEKLPVERVLSETYQVSRMTVRHALQYLEKEKVIHIDPHRGAFVMDVQIERSKEILSLTELMERRGYTCRSTVLELEKVKPDKAQQEFFQISEDEDVYLLHRIRYADDMVLAVERAYINAKFCEGLEMFNFEKFSLYDVFYEHYNMKIAYARDDIRADHISGSLARTLLNKEEGPALIVYNKGYDKNHNPIEYTKSVYNYKLFTYTVISTETTKRYD